MTWEEAVLWLRQQPDQQELVRDCFYDDPLIEAAERYYESTEWKAVDKTLPHPPGKALDLGAGRGISSYAMARDGWEVVALEPDTSDIVGAGAIRNLAKESMQKIRVTEEWGEGLPFENRSFDLVYCRAVLHHARDLMQLCREISRVMKRNGVLLATREHVISKREDLKIFLRHHPLHHLYGGEKAYLLREYLQAIRQAGLKTVRIINPLESDINLFPETVDGLKAGLAKSLSFPWPRLVPDTVVRMLGARDKTPGRLYTFLGEKGI